MPFEIEMKAWVDDWQAVETELRRRCTFTRSFRKEDRYYRAIAAPGGGQRGFRLRVDDGRAVVTFKEKRIRGDAEVNVEREFAVDDAAAFVELTGRLGCDEHFAKVKEGLHFEHDGMTVELVHVAELGDFLEVELLVERDDAEHHEELVRRIRAFVQSVGLPPQKFESRPYMQLLGDVRRPT